MLLHVVHIPDAAGNRDVYIALFGVGIGQHDAVAALRQSDVGKTIKLQTLIGMHAQRLRNQVHVFRRRQYHRRLVGVEKLLYRFGIVMDAVSI